MDRKPSLIPTWDAYFLTRVEASGECLLWTGFKDPSGYGRCQAAFARHLITTMTAYRACTRQSWTHI